MKNKFLIMCLALSACTVGPDYTKPETKLPETWINAKTNSEAELQSNWWRNFKDPELDKLIEKVSKDNFDIKIAEARILEARASTADAESLLLPQGDVSASANRQANQFQFPGAPPGIEKPFNVFKAGFDASWELDLFGKQQREIESAKAKVGSAEATRDDARIRLLAEVAYNYVDIRHYQAQLALANKTIETQQKTYDITNSLFKAGTAPKLDVIQAETRLNDTKSNLPQYEKLLAQSELATDVLLGEQAGYTHKFLSEKKESSIPVVDKEIIISAPAKVIANRPDIRIAERKLAAATAEQGVVVAQFFPDISLSGFLGLISIEPKDLLQSESKSWSATSGVLWPILSYGRLSANLDAANAGQQEALLNYQKSILVALADVETSVVAYQKDEERRNVLKASVDNNRKAAEIARARYKEGLTSFLEVLDAERSLYASEQNFLDVSAETAKNSIAVYKSLGGDL